MVSSMELLQLKKIDKTEFSPPPEKVRKYELCGTTFLSIRKASEILSKSRSTLGREIERNAIYHCRINKLFLFAIWQIDIIKALSQKLDYVEQSLISSDIKGGSKSLHGSFSSFDRDKRNERLQDVLEHRGEVKVTMKKYKIDQYAIIRGDTILPEYPQKTDEYLVSNNAWCRYFITKSMIEYYSKCGKWKHKVNININEFNEIRNALLEKDWTFKDIDSLLHNK